MGNYWFEWRVETRMCSVVYVMSKLGESVKPVLIMFCGYAGMNKSHFVVIV